jgi:hypothetical protein
MVPAQLLINHSFQDGIAMSDLRITAMCSLFALLVPASPLQADSKVKAESKSTTDKESEAESKSESDDSVTLRYQFQRGQYVHYEVESRSTMKVTARNTTQTLDQSRRTKKHYRVVTVDEQGSAVLEPIIDQVHMQVKTDDNEPVVFDSRNPSAELPKAFDTIEQNIGKAVVRVRFSALGRVEKVLGAARGDMDEKKTAFLVALPDEPVRPGEVWSDDFAVGVSPDPHLGPKLIKNVTIRRKYTLNKVKDGIAHISFRTYPMSIERNPHVQVQLVAQTLRGSVQFDVARGLVLESRSTSEGDVRNAFGPASAMMSTTNSVERFVNPPRKKRAPAGPELPGA